MVSELKEKFSRFGIIDLIISTGSSSQVTDLPAELGSNFLKGGPSSSLPGQHKTMVYFKLSKGLQTKNLRYFELADIDKVCSRGLRIYHRPDIVYKLRNYAKTNRRSSKDEAHCDIVDHFLICHKPNDKRVYPTLFLGSKLKSKYPSYGQLI